MLNMHKLHYNILFRCIKQFQMQFTFKLLLKILYIDFDIWFQQSMVKLLRCSFSKSSSINTFWVAAYGIKNFLLLINVSCRVKNNLLYTMVHRNWVTLSEPRKEWVQSATFYTISWRFQKKKPGKNFHISLLCLKKKKEKKAFLRICLASPCTQLVYSTKHVTIFNRIQK